MRSRIEFHTEWAIPEDLETPEADPQELTQDEGVLTAAASAGQTQPDREKWFVLEA